MNELLRALKQRVCLHVEEIYRDIDGIDDYSDIAQRILVAAQLENYCKDNSAHSKKLDKYWDETDIAMITYGDSVTMHNQAPLQTLKAFLDNYLSGLINIVHILPFFPYSSDDGFAVIDYVSVNESLGDWEDINKISQEYSVMADLVINHCSSRSLWFENFR